MFMKRSHVSLATALGTTLVACVVNATGGIDAATPQQAVWPRMLTFAANHGSTP